MKRMKLTKAGRCVIFLVLIALLSGGVFALFKTGVIKMPDNKKTVISQNTKKDKATNTSKPTSNGSMEMSISLDEWIGWKSIIDANGGLTTQPGSIYDELGLKLNISIINDGDQSSTAVIKGDLDGAGYTVNRYAFLLNKFKENNTDVVMPFITNYSNGGDGVITKTNINSVEDLVGKKIGVPRFSEGHTLIAWLVKNSDLSEDEQKQIIDNLVMFDTPDDAATAFFAGELDAAATWQPYLSQAMETTGCKILFDTSNATNLVLDGIAFNADYVKANKKAVETFIKGALMAEDMYTTEFTPIKNSMSLFATETNENIVAMTEDANLATYNNNIELLSSTAQLVFEDMSNIWLSLGETAYPEEAANVFDDQTILALKDEFETLDTKVPAFTEEQRQEAQKVDNTQALLKKSVTINFQPNSALFADQNEAAAALNEFVKIAKILDGSIIQVEGNIYDTGEGDNEAGRALSLQRAKMVAKYLQNQGIDPSRFVIIGNGITKQIGDNSTEEGKQMNRRTDIAFKVLE